MISSLFYSVWTGNVPVAAVDPFRGFSVGQQLQEGCELELLLLRSPSIRGQIKLIYNKFCGGNKSAN